MKEFFQFHLLSFYAFWQLLDEAMKHQIQRILCKWEKLNQVYIKEQILLSDLKNEGKTVILATSKPIPIAKEYLEYFDLIKYFDFIAGSNLDGTRINKREVLQYAVEQCKLNNLSNAVMIGDTIHDIIAAKEMGIDSIGVEYGIGAKEELLDATHIVKSVKELKNLLYDSKKLISSNMKYNKGISI